MSLSEPEEKNPFFIVGMVGALRFKGKSYEEIATQLKFDSVEEMRNRLESLQLPGWFVGAETNSDKKRVREKNTPRLRNFGPGKELPPAGNASELFKERLDALVRSVELLEHMDESLHGRYLVRQDVETASVLIPRELLTEERRRALSEQYDPNLDDEHFWDTNALVKLPGGVAVSPAETEAILIGVYALAGGDINTLLDALHLDRPSVGTETREKIRQCIEGSRANNDNKDGLKVLARQLATLVRGSEVRTGRPPRLSRADHAFACRITHYRNQGFTDEQIAHKESDRTSEDGTPYTVKDVTELGDLGLSWP